MDMEFLKLDATVRKRRGKGPARRLRARDLVPAVLYKKGQPTTAIAVNPGRLVKALSGPLRTNTVLSLELADSPKDVPAECKVIVRDHQFDPVTRQLLHVDFLALDVDKKFLFYVPFITTGRSIGEQTGGVLSIVYRTLPIECLPAMVPATVTVDVSSLDIHDTLSVSDLELPKDIAIELPPEQTVVQVLTTRIEEVEEEAEGEEGEEGEAKEGEAKESADKKKE
jgi:large subunit ribosomal protein L25